MLRLRPSLKTGLMMTHTPRPAAVRRTRAAAGQLIAAAAALLLLPNVAAAQGDADATRPTLVVLITVDQLRADYPDRFRETLTGGLARLTREGAWYVHGQQDHANTETAPGHATPMAGRFPRSHGIVRNSIGVPDPQHPLIGGGGDPASPFRYRGTSLFDWMRVHDPESRALSVSRKDRGAILPLGRAMQSVFWWTSDGRFTTSTYYADTLPDWVNRFNARRSARTLAGREWNLLLDESRYTAPDTVPAERPGRSVEEYTFPYRLPSDPDSVAARLHLFPWMDSLTVDMALEGVVAMNIGAGPHADFLGLSLSTTDVVGHTYGPDSRELHDQVLRVDREIGRFLDSLFILRDPGRVVVALTADHGVSPLPGVTSLYPNAEAQRVSLTPLLRATRAALEPQGVEPTAFRLTNGDININSEAFTRAGVNADSVVDGFIREALALPGVQRAIRWRDLAGMDSTGDHVVRRLMHMYPPDLAPEAVIVLRPYNAWGNATQHQHGAPHDPDAFVPVVFWGEPFAPARHERRVRVVDMAATLAWMLGVPPLEKLDGVVLSDAFRSATAADAQPQARR